MEEFDTKERAEELFRNVNGLGEKIVYLFVF